MASLKPPIHGRDHLPGHADPIPGLEELITDTVGGSLAPAHCIYNSDGITAGSSTVSPIPVASGSGEYVDWVAEAGDTTLLDVSTSGTAFVTTRGVYAVHATFSGTGLWTPGSQYWAVLSANGDDILGSSIQWRTVGERDLPHGGTAFLGRGHVSLTMDMPVGGQFQMQVNNYDDSTHDMSAYMLVQRIFVY